MSFLQIASWNVEHLSGWRRKDRKQSAFALADHIEMAGIDLITLQEVYATPTDEEVRLADDQPVIESRAIGSRRNSDLDMVCYLLEEHLKKPWKYTILPNRNSGDKSQLCAVMWDDERLTIGNPVPLNVNHIDGNLNLWDRKPHYIPFSSEIKVWRRSESGEWTQESEGRTIAIVPLHMKSNYGGITKNRLVRTAEAKTLCEAIKEIENEPYFDPSLILLGDTNILSNDEPAIETFIKNGFLDLNNYDSATYWSKDYGEAPFDRIFVKENRPEFKYSRQYVLKASDLTQHDRFLSDHYMIKMSVKDYIDDADPR